MLRAAVLVLVAAAAVTATEFDPTLLPFRREEGGWLQVCTAALTGLGASAGRAVVHWESRQRPALHLPSRLPPRPGSRRLQISF